MWRLAASPHSWTEEPHLQCSKYVQHRAHEMADEETLPQCAACMHPVRCVCSSLEHKPHCCLSCLLFVSFRSEWPLQEEACGSEQNADKGCAEGHMVDKQATTTEGMQEKSSLWPGSSKNFQKIMIKVQVLLVLVTIQTVVTFFVLFLQKAVISQTS